MLHVDLTTDAPAIIPIIRNTIQTKSITFSHITLTFGLSALVTKVRAICSFALNVMDIPMKTTQDKHSRVVSYCQTIGLFSINLQNTDTKNNTDRNAMRKIVIAVAALFKEKLIFSIVALIILTSFKGCYRGG